MSPTAAATDDRPQVERTDADLRLRIVHAAMDLLREHSFHCLTLEAVAVRADLEPAAVRERFAAVADLGVATAQVWHGERVGPIMGVAEAHGAVAFLRAILTANLADPALVRLLFALTDIAAAPDDPNAAPLQAAWVQFHAHVQRTLTRDVETGREPGTMDPAHGAEQLIALFEGLQVQKTMRPHMDLLAAYDRAVARLRAGWSATYEQAVWEI